MKVISIKSSAVYVSDRSLLHFIFCICVPLETIYDSCVVYVDQYSQKNVQSVEIALWFSVNFSYEMLEV